MYKIVLEIVHKRCWGSEINVKYPNYEFSSIDCRWIGPRVAHILRAVGDSSKFDEIVGYLGQCHDVSDVEVLSRDSEKIFIRTLTHKSKKNFQFSDIFFENNCFPLSGTKFIGNKEVWTLGTASKENFTPVYDYLKKKYPVRIASMTKETILEELTEKQREALNYAHLFGYYEWPRKNSVADIASILGVPKTVFLSHLRKAEKKVIDSYFSSK